MYKEIDFSKINVEFFAKRTRQQIRELKQIIKNLDCLINRDFGLIVDINSGKANFLNPSEQAKKLYEMQKEANQIMEQMKGFKK